MDTDTHIVFLFGPYTNTETDIVCLFETYIDTDNDIACLFFTDIVCFMTLILFVCLTLL